MTNTPLATLYQSLDQHRPATLEALLAGVSLLLPILDAIPNAAIFIKDPAARYVLANNTLVQRCGLKRLQPLLGKTSAEVFPAQLGPGYTEQDRRVLKEGRVLEDQLELHLYGSREPGWCLTHKRRCTTRRARSSAWLAFRSTCNQPPTVTLPINAWPRWTSTFASIFTSRSAWASSPVSPIFPWPSWSATASGCSTSRPGR